MQFELVGIRKLLADTIGYFETLVNHFFAYIYFCVVVVVVSMQKNLIKQEQAGVFRKNNEK